MKTENKVHFIASVEDEYIDRIDDIVRSLETKGFDIEKVRYITGTISGSTSSLAEIQHTHIEGLHIQAEKTYTIQ